jgi:peptide/nickel transport system permease protein
VAVIDHDVELRRAGANVRGVGGAIVHFVRRYPLGAIGAVLMLLFIATAIFADQITSYDPTSTNPRVSLARPGEQHVLGADFMGRDVFARIVYGSRISLAVAIGATALGCLMGVSIGLLSGFFGGWVDLIVQRLIDIMQALPLLVMALIMAASLGPSPIPSLPSPFRSCPMSPGSSVPTPWRCGKCLSSRPPAPSA